MTCRITIPLQERDPVEKRQPMRIFFVLDVLVLHRMMSGTDKIFIWHRTVSSDIRTIKCQSTIDSVQR